MNQFVEESVELLRQMVATPSESFEEDAVCSLVCSRLEGWGMPYERIGDNIVVRCPWFDPSLPSLALDAHIDTVPPSSSYTFDPYDSGSDPLKVRGLGSNDDGGSVAAMIAVMRHFSTQRIPVNPVLSLTCQEERSGRGGATLLYAPGGKMDSLGVKWAIVGEPTGMRAATSERGLLVLDALATGVSGHAARDEGVNALYIALDDIAKLRSFNFDRISPVMGKVKLSVTQINAGTAHNVVPDRCSFVVDIRPTEQYSPEEILNLLQDECASVLTPRNLSNRSSCTAEGSALAEAARSCGIGIFSSSTTSNWLRMHCDAIKMGPGDSGRSHRGDEFILCSEIEQAFDIYIEFIKAFYGKIVE